MMTLTSIDANKMKARIFPGVLFVLLIWTVLITVFGTGITQSTGQGQIATEGILWPLIFAAGNALLAAGAWRVWSAIGYKGVSVNAKWGLLVVPVLFILLFLVRGFSLTFLEAPVLLLLLLNTLIVSIGEETMFRGLLFSGLYSRFSYWRAILITTFLFGVIHIFNGTITGDFAISVFQAVNAVLIGFMLMAIRIVMGSIIPAILIHWLWNFGVFLNTASPPSTDPTSAVQVILSVLFLLSAAAPLTMGVIGIVSLRRYKKRLDQSQAEIAANEESNRR